MEHETAQQLYGELKSQCINDPACLASAIDGTNGEIRERFFLLLGYLCQYDLQAPNRPNAWIEARDFCDTVSELAEHVETMVEDYLENTAND